MKLKIFVAIVLMAVGANSHALVIGFSFDQSGPAVFGGTAIPGSVTGTISGLVDNTANQLTGITVTINSFPAGLGGVPNNGLVASNWPRQFGMGFSVFGGVMTAAQYAAQTSTCSIGDNFCDDLRLNVSSDVNLLTFDGFATSTGNRDGFGGSTYSDATAVPEPGTLALLGLGLLGLAFARRKA